MTPESPAKSAPLWQLLQATARVLAGVNGGASATALLAQVPAPLRPGAQALAFAALRGWGRAQALRKKLASRPPKPEADALLCLALALLGEGPDSAGYDDFTLVNQAVEAAKRQPSTAGQAAFINACLRSFLRERDALQATLAGDEVAVWNHPAWWIRRLRQEHPSAWQAILAANNTQPPLTLRVNTARTTREAAQNAIESVAGRGRSVSESGLILSEAVPVQQIPGFAAGDVSVQDAAAQLAAPLLLQPWLDGAIVQARPLRVLDACAAPGGKTAHLLELGARLQGGVEVTALDVDAGRCRLIEQNLIRLGLQAQVRAADAGDTAAWWDGQAFDAILLDAPCTASGIVRRHPDVRWLRRESDIAALATTQAQLLRALWPLLRPGGRLLYCTCSVFQAEGPQQIQTFLAHNKDAAQLPSPGQLLPRNGANPGAVPDNRPDDGPDDRDGFFYALLAKG